MLEAGFCFIAIVCLLIHILINYFITNFCQNCYIHWSLEIVSGQIGEKLWRYASCELKIGFDWVFNWVFIQQ